MIDTKKATKAFTLWSGELSQRWPEYAGYLTVADSIRDFAGSDDYEEMSFSEHYFSRWADLAESALIFESDRRDAVLAWLKYVDPVESNPDHEPSDDDETPTFKENVVFFDDHYFVFHMCSVDINSF